MTARRSWACIFRGHNYIYRTGIHAPTGIEVEAYVCTRCGRIA